MPSLESFHNYSFSGRKKRETKFTRVIRPYSKPEESRNRSLKEREWFFFHNSDAMDGLEEFLAPTQQSPFLKTVTFCDMDNCHLIFFLMWLNVFLKCQFFIDHYYTSQVIFLRLPRGRCSPTFLPLDQIAIPTCSQVLIPEPARFLPLKSLNMTISGNLLQTTFMFMCRYHESPDLWAFYIKKRRRKELQN